MRTLVAIILLAGLLAGCSSASVTPAPTPTETPTIPLLVDHIAEPTPTEPEAKAYPPSLYLDPASLSLAVGETAVIRVWGDGMDTIRSLSLELAFDPMLVQIEDADPGMEGTQVTPGNLLEAVQENRVEPGRVIYRASVSSGAPPRESGLLFSFGLQGMAAGVTPLKMASSMAQDASGNPVDIQFLSDGLITIEEERTPPPPQGIPLPVFPTAAPLPEAMPTPQLQPADTGGIYYVVSPGETLYRIGLKFGTTAEAIAATNHIVDPHRVPAGTMLLIPVPAPGGGYGYCVRPRDTVYSIARRFGMTVDELVTLNGIGPDYRIHPDTILKVVPRGISP